MTELHEKFVLRTEIQDHIGTIRFSCPPYNHVSVELLQAMAAQILALDEVDDCRVVILRSEGKVFCAGADFNEGGDFAADDDDAAVLGLYAQAARLYSNRKPIIAIVQGAAIGAGLGLALVADFRIGSEQSRFAANFVKLGFHAGFGISTRLPEIVGQQNAARMLLTGERVAGATALDWGLIDILAATEHLEQSAVNFARQIAENAPLAVEATRATLRADVANRVQLATSYEAAVQSRLKKTEDFAEGVQAVAQRRPGQFKRR